MKFSYIDDSDRRVYRITYTFTRTVGKNDLKEV